jgi:hypothetical protein
MVREDCRIAHAFESLMTRRFLPLNRQRETPCPAKLKKTFSLRYKSASLGNFVGLISMILSL